jgi:hypothetical protein
MRFHPAKPGLLAPSTATDAEAEQRTLVGSNHNCNHSCGLMQELEALQVGESQNSKLCDRPCNTVTLLSWIIVLTCSTGPRRGRLQQSSRGTSISTTVAWHWIGKRRGWRILRSPNSETLVTSNPLEGSHHLQHTVAWLRSCKRREWRIPDAEASLPALQCLAPWIIIFNSCGLKIGLRVESGTWPRYRQRRKPRHRDDSCFR